jgi:hypothetical protein
MPRAVRLLALSNFSRLKQMPRICSQDIRLRASISNLTLESMSAISRAYPCRAPTLPYMLPNLSPSGVASAYSGHRDRIHIELSPAGATSLFPAQSRFRFHGHTTGRYELCWDQSFYGKGLSRIHYGQTGILIYVSLPYCLNKTQTIFWLH